MTYSAVHDLFIDERELRVYSNGSGKPVLMLHDLGTSAATFEHLTTPLVRADRELVAVDLPGSGRSDPVPGTDLASYVEHLAMMLPSLGSDPIDILGHGFGGYLAACLAARYPQLIHRLLLCEPAAPPRSGPPASGRMSPGMALSGAMTTLRRGKLRQNLQGFSRAKSVLDQLGVADPGWWDSLGRITAPTMVLCTSAAEVGERAVMDLIAAAIPGAVRATMACPRRPHTSAPVEFSTQILEFFCH
ncbi:alpha/beta fold hydrolase [Nakamurella sp. PAMC28650]|uniref:alpha/beta fold hydrolase n=1 Tax=Nakamurella sp. PAMC28650 TaxID=2762325 RepID=UPI00164E0ED0|nr:alpha/beta hydrolase [Nakamurella sp. PAMC28650]QNK81023.1 alpha/beta hydrolase [Nakamurella sp. PAMC28650]